MEKDMRNKPQLNPAQLITADLWLIFLLNILMYHLKMLRLPSLKSE